MSDRDARYRQQAMRAEQRADRWCSRALDAYAALAIATSDPAWLDDLDAEDRQEARSRMVVLRSRLVTRSR